MMQAEYVRRIHQTVDYLESHLDQNLSVEILAKVACYSPFHFHRVFSLVIGMSVNSYVTKKRLERVAASLLVTPKAQIKLLAYTYGFNSGTSLSRSFKKQYGVSPSAFIKHPEAILSKIGIVPFSPEIYFCHMETLKEWMANNASIRLENRQELKLASISHIGEFERIGSMFKELIQWGQGQQILTPLDFKAVLVYHDNPKITELSKLRYSVGVTTRDAFETNGVIRPLTLDGGDYVIGRFEIESAAIPKAWEGVSNWVLENGYQFRDGHYFESYLNDANTHPDHKHEIEIYIPIEKPQEHTQGPWHRKETPNKTSIKSEQVVHSRQDAVQFMKTLRAFFIKNYETFFKLGKVYQGSPDYTYVSLTTEAMGVLKLKFVYVIDIHSREVFICLSGQNKAVRRQYWNHFKAIDWQIFPLVAHSDDSLYIMKQSLVESANFEQQGVLIETLESGGLHFINTVSEALGDN